MPGSVSIRVYAELNDLVSPSLPGGEHVYDLHGKRSIKDLLESIGIPHTEIGLILVDHQPVHFSHTVNGGEQISVYPVFRSIDIPAVASCQPAAMQNPRFILDNHLGRLAALLRMIGFDTLYRNDYDDRELADISARDDRILLTCDRQLLMRKQLTRGYFVRSRKPEQQVIEIIQRYDLGQRLRPFTRCMKCNGCLFAVNKGDIDDLLAPATRECFDSFRQCDSCSRIYWQGSHYMKMKSVVENITRDSNFSRTGN